MRTADRSARGVDSTPRTGSRAAWTARRGQEHRPQSAERRGRRTAERTSSGERRPSAGGAQTARHRASDRGERRPRWRSGVRAGGGPGPLTFRLGGGEQQRRAQGGERRGEPGPHARPPSSRPHEGTCGDKRRGLSSGPAGTAPDWGLHVPGSARLRGPARRSRARGSRGVGLEGRPSRRRVQPASRRRPPGPRAPHPARGGFSGVVVAQPPLDAAARGDVRSLRALLAAQCRGAALLVPGARKS